MPSLIAPQSSRGTAIAATAAKTGRPLWPSWSCKSDRLRADSRRARGLNGGPAAARPNDGAYGPGHHVRHAPTENRPRAPVLHRTDQSGPRPAAAPTRRRRPPHPSDRPLQVPLRATCGTPADTAAEHHDHGGASPACREGMALAPTTPYPEASMIHPATTTARLPNALADLMTPLDVSRYLGVPPGTLANWRYLGRGPAFLRVGRHVRYRTADVTAWVEAQLTDRAQRSGSDQERGISDTAASRSKVILARHPSTAGGVGKSASTVRPSPHSRASRS